MKVISEDLAYFQVACDVPDARAATVSNDDVVPAVMDPAV